jgi:hypothetical protein
MTHTFHEGLPGYDPRQIWFDGCEECESRGEHAVDALGSLDSERFHRAWRRAADWNKDRDVGPVSNAERPLLTAIWRFQVALERECKLPIGELPTDYVPRTQTVDVVFNGPPGAVPGRFVEVEDLGGASVSVGRWIEREDGYWALRIEVAR